MRPTRCPQATFWKHKKFSFSGKIPPIPRGPNSKNRATNTCPGRVVEVKPLRDGFPKARERGSRGSEVTVHREKYSAPQATAQEGPAIPSDGIRAQIITPLMLLIKTWKPALHRGGLYSSVTMYSTLCKSHGLGPTSATTTILRKENSVSVLV